jgi:tocopherol cyclase
MRATMLPAYRATGADPPFGDPRGYHGVGMEGYFWRLTQAAEGVVVVALLAVSRDAAGRPWGMVALAAHPGGVVRSASVAHAVADPRSLRVRVGHDAEGDGPAVLEADDGRLRVDLGPDARLDVSFADRKAWPARWAFGGIGPAQAIPGLSQYWHPHLLGASVRGSLQLGAERLDLAGSTAYAEKNWGAGGHPPDWWWGQAHGFGDDEACVAFAGGRATAGPVPVRATAAVVVLGGNVLRIARPPGPLAVTVDDRGWRLRGRAGRHRVEIEGHAHGIAPHRLPVPHPAQRRRLDGWSAMHLAGTMRVHVSRRGRTVFAGVSELAGLERGRGPHRDAVATR